MLRWLLDKNVRALRRRGVAHVVGALGGPEFARHTAEAVAYYLDSNNPDGAGTILNVGTGLLHLLAFGEPGRIARDYFGRDFIIPEMGLCTRRFDAANSVSAALPFTRISTYSRRDGSS